MKKFLIGMGAVLVGGVTVSILTFGQNSNLKVNASEIDEQIKQKLDNKYGEDWDDVLESTYGDKWLDELETKFSDSINTILPDEVRRLMVLDLIEDEMENNLEALYGDDWDDLLESVYGDDWDDVLELKYGKDYVLKLEEELKQISTQYPQGLPNLNHDDLDDDHDDLYDRD